jgi:hypothetical protein
MVMHLLMHIPSKILKGRLEDKYLQQQQLQLQRSGAGNRTLIDGGVQIKITEHKIIILLVIVATEALSIRKFLSFLSNLTSLLCMSLHCFFTTAVLYRTLISLAQNLR